MTVRVLPFVPQPDYDRLLWACDLNFVRGEDSWVRAQWAGKPFVWHIYPQDEHLHHKKLRAFLGRYVPDIDSVQRFMLHWNGAQRGSGRLACAVVGIAGRQGTDRSPLRRLAGAHAGQWRPGVEPVGFCRFTSVGAASVT